MRKVALLIIAAVTLTSCASVTPVSFSYTETYFPAIGVEETEELGATLLSYVNVAEMDSYRIVRQIQTKKNFAGVYSVFPPQVFALAQLPCGNLDQLNQECQRPSDIFVRPVNEARKHWRILISQRVTW